VTSPADVAAEVEQQAYAFHRQAVGQITLAASHLTPCGKAHGMDADSDSIDRALDLHACRVAEGHHDRAR
jgi:hypothetical protein